MEMIFYIIFLAVGIAIGAVIAWFAKSADVKALKVQIEAERARAQELIGQANANAEAQVRQERETAKSLREESDKQWELKLATLKNDMLKATAEHTRLSGEALRKDNDSSLADLLKPIKEQFEAFKKSVDEVRTQNEVNKNDIESKFENTLKLFQAQQERNIDLLKDETSKIGNDAVNLAKALKSDTKRQGNWGEMVLQTMLENSGLEEGVHFFVQYNVKDEEGKRNIPDVVIKFPEGRSLIIDSKVSLKAYTEYFETDDEQRQSDLLKAHLASVEKHIDELSIKNYPRVVENSMDYVLMFIPNESSYVAALKLNPNLLREAYEKKVIIVSPNNLLMALQLALNLWQADKQVKNIKKIVDRGSLLYKKVADFQSTFESIGDGIDKLRRTFDKAKGQLSEGSGNVLAQCERLRDYGIKIEQNKRIKMVEGYEINEEYEG